MADPAHSALAGGSLPSVALAIPWRPVAQIGCAGSHFWRCLGGTAAFPAAALSGELQLCAVFLRSVLACCGPWPVTLLFPVPMTLQDFDLHSGAIARSGLLCLNCRVSVPACSSAGLSVTHCLLLSAAPAACRHPGCGPWHLAARLHGHPPPPQLLQAHALASPCPPTAPPKAGAAIVFGARTRALKKL
jgi:hypothetical protein